MKGEKGKAGAVGDPLTIEDRNGRLLEGETAGDDARMRGQDSEAALADVVTAAQSGGGRRHGPDSGRQVSKRQTRERILRAARRVFETSPYETATTRLIAGVAEISPASLFKHFPDKAELWRTAMGCEPPVDSPEARRAPDAIEALRRLLAFRPEDWADPTRPERAAAWRGAEDALSAYKQGGGFEPAPRRPLRRQRTSL